MDGINKMCETLEGYSIAEVSKDREKINTKELGEVVDVMKDLSEVKKNKAEECYYYALIDAMENADYGQDYDYRGRMGYQQGGNQGQRGSGRGNSNNRSGYNMGYPDERMMDMRNGRMGYSNSQYNQPMRNSNSSSSRYGYSHDEYMEAKQMYSPNDPEGKRKRMEALDDNIEDLTDSVKELVAGMSPEEKQHWKSKIGNIINM